MGVMMRVNGAWLRLLMVPGLGPVPAGDKVGS